MAVVVGVNGRSNSAWIGMDGLTYSGELLTNYGAHWMGSIKQNMARAFLVAAETDPGELKCPNTVDKEELNSPIER